ncbi:MAG: LysR family transcriptional regulator [Opitutaceae bacterium]|nr:LysR family transcriptional regulator [Opitutaceae bacterium]
MELHQFRYLVAIAETGNFTRASERCNITQPSLSQQIINLEREVGRKLFHRLGRKAVLTEAGITFLERARRILFEVENAAKELSDSPTLGRRITVGAIPTVAPYLLPPLLARCREQHPNLEIQVREDFRGPLVRGVVEGELDVAISALPVKDARISVETLLTELLLLVVGKSHPLATRPRVVARDLADETFVMLGASSSLAAEVQRFCGDHHFEPRIGYRCSQVATVKAFVELGVGISILPRVAQAPADEAGLVYIVLSGGAPTRELGVIRHLQRYQSRGVEQFLQLLRESTSRMNPA